MSAPAMSWQYVLVAPGKLERRERALDQLADGWARVRVLYCGICGSDLSTFEGRRDVTYPVSLGHEFLAEVWETAGDAGDLAKGDIVTSDLNFRCGRCDQCRRRRSHLCRTGQRGMFSNRGFAQFSDLHASYLTRIDSPADRQLALTEPLSCVLHALRWAAPQPSERVLIVGAGGLAGCLAFALSSQKPALPFEITDKLPARSALTAAATTSARAVPTPDGEYDVVFDLSGSEAGLSVACQHTTPGGRLCTMSHLDGYSKADFLLASLTRRDITFTVSYLNGERDTMRNAAIALAESWTPAWDRLVHVLPAESLQSAFETRRVAPWCKTLIEIAPPSSEVLP
jgi:threonine dehydrogenase-like Zn-dependent dehydrogenase